MSKQLLHLTRNRLQDRIARTVPPTPAAPEQPERRCVSDVAPVSGSRRRREASVRRSQAATRSQTTSARTPLWGRAAAPPGLAAVGAERRQRCPAPRTRSRRPPRWRRAGRSPSPRAGAGMVEDPRARRPGLGSEADEATGAGSGLGRATSPGQPSSVRPSRMGGPRLGAARAPFLIFRRRTRRARSEVGDGGGHDDRIGGPGGGRAGSGARARGRSRPDDVDAGRFGARATLAHTRATLAPRAAAARRHGVTLPARSSGCRGTGPGRSAPR